MGEVIAEKISNGIMNRPGRNELNVRHINVVNLYTPSQININELEYFNATEKDIERCNVEIGDIFLTRSSLKVEGIAQANILLDKGSFVFDDHIMRLKLATAFEPFFVKEALNHSSTKKEFMVKSKTGTMTTIGQDDITSSSIVLPAKKEQAAIGDFFRILDNTITLRQRELDGLRKLKKAYLQQMFPQAGERVPKVRFAGFNGDWRGLRFKDIVNRVSTQSNASNLPKIEFEDILSGEGRLNKNVSVKYDNRKGIAFEPENILYGKLRPYLNNWLFATFKGIALGDFWVYEAKSIIPSFVYSLIQTGCYQEVANLSTGTKMPRSDWGLVSETIFLVPLDECEQTAIGNFFRNLDNQVADQQTKLDKLKQLKTAYLQRMFV